MTDRPLTHKQIEDRINAAISRIQTEVQLSSIGKSQIRQAIQAGVKGPALAGKAREAHRSGWIPGSHRFHLDKFGCIRRVELRFFKWENGEKQTMSRLIVAGPDGRISEGGEDGR